MVRNSMKFSIVVVTYNRAILLNNFLTQFRSVEYSAADYEIIVVDNGSTDNTQGICIHMKTILPNLRYVYESHGGQSFARNTGISTALNEHILFLDDDEKFPPTILRRYTSAWKKYPKSFAIGGKIIAREQQNKRKICVSPNYSQYGWMLGEIDYGNTERKLIYPETLLSGNLSVRINPNSRSKSYFDTALGRRLSKRTGLGAEDYEYCLRAHLQHKDVRYIPLLVYNIIGSNRLTCAYQLLRNFLAGVERHIIDRHLKKKYKGHVVFAFSLKKMLTIDLRSGWSEILDKLFYITFSLGYYGYKFYCYNA